ncbi:MAG: FecR domain-containing protein, partial [Deltaproteobacteria bacterium]|nr:FecR domain-containing protein [Deltaproteobacteria bacterium]
MRTECTQVHDDLADLVAGDPGAIDRHADHLAGCDDCRDARHDAARVAALLPHAGADHVTPPDLVERLLAALPAEDAGRTLPGAAIPVEDAGRTQSAALPAEDAGQTLPGIAVSTEADAPARQLPPVAPAAPATIDAAASTAPAKQTPASTAPTKQAPAKQAPASTAPAKQTPASTAPASTAPASTAPAKQAPVVPLAARRGRSRRWLAAGAIAAVAAGGIGIYAATRDRSGDDDATTTAAAGGTAATVKSIDRAAAASTRGGLEIKVPGQQAWQVVAVGDAIPAGAEVRSDERTRAAVELADGTRLVLDHRTAIAFDPADARRTRLTSGRIVADVVHVDARPAAIETPSGRIDVVGTRLAVTASDALTVVQVVRGSVKLTAQHRTETVHAGEEGVIDKGALTVDAAPGLAREVEWSELGAPKQHDTTGTGLGALRAYKPGESRDRDWNLALAKHDVKVRVSGPVARTEITETFRNDSAETLEGVYQFPLPPDAQIDALSLDVDGGFVDGAFVDKHRAQKIWRGVIDKAAPKKQEIATSEIIWVEGAWRDPALLDWKRGGRFELRIFPIPAKGSRTIKLAYTQVVTPRGPYRQYVYPLPHSADGSTVADQMTVDVEVRGAAPGEVRAAGYDLAPDPARRDVNALTLAQTGFVPRGDLVVTYRPTDGDAELRAWTFAGGTAAAPDDKLAAKKNVGIDPAVVDAQRAVAADARPTAVLALRPKLPRWRAAEARDYMIVVDASQSMLGERFARSTELATRLVEQMDRRDRFGVMACDSECRSLGDLRAPTVRTAQEAAAWLAAQAPAGASDLVASVRAAAAAIPADKTPGKTDRERWVIYVGDGFASTGFRRAADLERAVASSLGTGTRVTTIGIGTDADPAALGAVARGGGGSYLAWVPGQSVKTAAVAGLESTYGTALRDATIELPAGLADVAPTVLPTVRAGEEVLIAARMTGDVAGNVVVRGTVAGEKFEQTYPLRLAVSSASGNGFVPRLWASLAIEQLERRGRGDERPRLVALSQGYGVMSKETSLLVLESQAMFDAFGVDRSRPAAPAWTGEEALDEVVANGTVAPQQIAQKTMALGRGAAAAPKDAGAIMSPDLDKAEMPPGALKKAPSRPMGPRLDPFSDSGRIAMRRTWIRVPSVSAYDKVHPAIVQAIGDAERALAKNPDSRERHRNLVQALSYAGELDRAHAMATKWLGRDQLDPQALGYQADLLGRAGKRELGLRTLAGVVDLDADRAAPHERMVRAYEAVGRLAQACGHRIAL